jgi:hypothetical protein
MALTVEEIRRRQRDGGRIGGLTKRLLFGVPHRDAPIKARRVYRESFSIAHGGDPTHEPWASMARRDRPVGLCAICPERTVVPEDVSPERRAEMASALRAIHYQRLARCAVDRRRATR